MDLKALENKFFKHSEKKYFFPLANAYREEKRLEECIKIFQEGLTLFPNYWAAKVAFARALFEKGDFEQALEVLELAAEHIPENLLLHELLACIYRGKGDIPKAIHHCRLVLFINPFHEKCLQIEEEALIGDTTEYSTIVEEGREDFNEELLQEGEAETDQSAEEEILTATLAEVYVAQGCHEKAIEIYQKLIENQPEEEVRWKKRIEELQADQNSPNLSELLTMEEAKKNNELILRQLEEWLKNIEKREKVYF